MGFLKIVMKMMTVTTINCDISWENSKLDFHMWLRNEGAILVYLCTYFLSFQFIFKCLAALYIWKYVYRPAIFWNIALFRQQNKTIQFKLQWIDNGKLEKWKYVQQWSRLWKENIYLPFIMNETLILESSYWLCCNLQAIHYLLSFWSWPSVFTFYLELIVNDIGFIE